jgi:hypothetical protein
MAKQNTKALLYLISTIQFAGAPSGAQGNRATKKTFNLNCAPEGAPATGSQLI